MFEEDLAQVDRYKQLLLKQRDIMIALTARLNERDEQIMTLQVGLGSFGSLGVFGGFSVGLRLSGSWGLITIGN